MNMTEDQIISKAIEILESRVVKGNVVSDPESAAQYARLKLANKEHEVFAVLFLNNSNTVIEYRELFTGTIDQSAVYPREVVKAALYANAAAVIFAHNHPSNKIEPSQADIRITEKLAEALATIEINVLDHLIVGQAGTYSFAESGLL